MLKIVISFVLLSGLSIVSFPSTADEASDKAKELFNAGVTHFKTERYEMAAMSFREANRLNPNWKIFFNIGQSEAAAKRWGLALEAFEQYLVEGGDEIPSDRERVIRTEIEKLKTKLGSVEIVAPKGAKVQIDGMERGVAPLPGRIRVATGTVHRLRVILDDAVLLDRQIKVGSQDNLSLTVAPEYEHNKSSPKLFFVLGWSLLGGGAAVALGGAITGGVVLSKKGQLEDDCPNRICTTKEEEKLLDEATTLGTVTTVLVSVGLATALAGSTLLVLDALKKEESKSVLTVSTSPVVTPSFGGWVIQGRF